MTGATDDARYVRADRDDDDSMGAPLVDDDAFFDHVQAENSIVGFYLLVKIAALQSMLDRRLTRADTQVFGMILYRLNPEARTAWPSYELIARGTGVSEAQVKRSIGNLRHFGYVVSKRAGLAGSAHWLVQYSIGPIVAPRTIERQIEQAIARLRRRPIDGFSNVGPASLAPTAPATNCPHPAAGWSQPSHPRGAKLMRLGGPRGAKLRRLAP